jgi:endoglucanase
MDALAQRPQAIWLGEWNEDIGGDVREIMRLAQAERALPVFVVYFIPLRDCGSYSRGGAVSAEFYREWIAKIENAIGNGPAAIILEPDALAGMDCLAADKQAERVSLIRGAVESLSRHSNISVYVDAGNARWKPAREMARVLKSANIGAAAGFALNVSNFLTTEESIAYGEQISKATGGKHFLIDTSRNGAGPTADLAWCNPTGRALGARPTVNTGHPLVDAFLWVKRPGESDGECNGGPAAGVWWPEYALALARRAGY